MKQCVRDFPRFVRSDDIFGVNKGVVDSFGGVSVFEDGGLSENVCDSFCSGSVNGNYYNYFSFDVGTV